MVVRGVLAQNSRRLSPKTTNSCPQSRQESPSHSCSDLRLASPHKLGKTALIHSAQEQRALGLVRREGRFKK